MASSDPVLTCKYHQHGDPKDVLKFEDRERPIASPNQVLVEVHCAALNPVGWKSMKYFPSIAVKKPAIAEMDLSGVVVSVGANVKNFKCGDEVFGIIPAELEMKTGIGALAQYTVVEEDHLAKKPESIL